MGLAAFGASGAETASKPLPTTTKGARAKSVIQIWMAGGPSHLDTFDPKPNAGRDHGYEGSIPPYIVLTSPQGRFSEAGFLGSKYKPFVTGGDPNKNPFLVSGFVVEGVSKQRHQERRRLLDSLDVLGRAGSPAARAN